MLLIENYPSVARGVAVSGVYAITGKNGKRYVGSSVNILTRIHKHKCDLRKGKHRSTLMLFDYNKHGFEFFTYSVLEQCTTDQLREREQAYMRQDYSSLYNKLHSAVGHSILTQVGGKEYLSKQDFDREIGYEQSQRRKLERKGMSLEQIAARARSRSSKNINHRGQMGLARCKPVVLQNGVEFSSNASFAKACGLLPVTLGSLLRRGKTVNEIAQQKGLM